LFTVSHFKQSKRGSIKMKSQLMLLFSVSMIVSCGGTNDELSGSGSCPSGDSGVVDSGMVDSNAVDSGRHRDSGVADSGGVRDSAVADVGSRDTSVVDSSMADTSAVDSSMVADTSAPPPPDGGNWWKPNNSQPISFHWQLSQSFSYPADVVAGGEVYDIDGETNTAATIASLHSIGAKVICYVDVGTAENFRGDYASFPQSVLGNTNGWPGERWLDVRQIAVIMPIMKARFVNWCLDRGADGVEIDNEDAYENSSGFPITPAESLAYDIALADMVHSLGMAVGQKNMPEYSATMQPYSDWVLDEQCFQYGECSGLNPYATASKPIWEVEYSQSPNCSQAALMFMFSQKRDLNLNGASDNGYLYQPCIPDGVFVW
jgi:hypothetical protein